MSPRALAAVGVDSEGEASSTGPGGEGPQAGQPPRRLGRHAAVVAVLGALVVLVAVAVAGRSTLHDGRVRLSRGTQGDVALEIETQRSHAPKKLEGAADAASGTGVEALRDNVTELQTQLRSLDKTAGPASAADVQALKDNITELQMQLSYMMDRFPAEQASGPLVMPRPAPQTEDATLRPLGPGQKYCGRLAAPANATCCNGIAGAPFSTCCPSKIICGRGTTCCGNICCAPEAVCCNGMCGAPNANCTAAGIILAPIIKPTQSPRANQTAE